MVASESATPTATIRSRRLGDKNNSKFVAAPSGTVTILEKELMRVTAPDLTPF